ncbi:hypothetical protein [Marinagarivorans cellulosilyticus]|uniref:Uncharacterized protein n=1 Tax=Marinagarivorans cellulosilyticus TaxID=2721545 RepID=A0AAN1WHG6_9GAMM|nr:hypothetical protein [Marinagarivorans cellulosilyticus]BCD97677.1 hypothetical protein MARGE09_P1878 [Marinagarivorans cellulosilyticus]
MLVNPKTSLSVFIRSVKHLLIGVGAVSCVWLYINGAVFVIEESIRGNRVLGMLVGIALVFPFIVAVNVIVMMAVRKNVQSRPLPLRGLVDVHHHQNVDALLRHSNVLAWENKGLSAEERKRVLMGINVISELFYENGQRVWEGELK